MRVTIVCAVLIVWSWSVSAAAQTLRRGIVAGAVVDEVGAAVVDAAVTMTTADGTTPHNAKTDAQGAFSFSDVAPGSYVVHIDVAGFTPFSSGTVTVSADTGAVTLPRIVLIVGAFSTSITVRSTEAVAEEQIKNQESQRWLGVMPNFYVSYVPDAAALTSRQKFTLAAHESFDWTAFAGASIAAAIDQSTSAHPGFGDGASGYAKRWAASFADNRTGDLLSHYVFASLFHQDPRYFYQGTGTTQSRLVHALGSAFVARSDRGTLMPNYAYMLGNVGAAALSNTYYPSRERGASLVFSNFAMGLAGRAAKAVTQEFLGKRLTKHVPAGDGHP
jgi:Carboxypeptidase regulatory-like domain